MSILIACVLRTILENWLRL